MFCFVCVIVCSKFGFSLLASANLMYFIFLGSDDESLGDKTEDQSEDAETESEKEISGSDEEHDSGINEESASEAAISERFTSHIVSLFL